MHTTHRHSQLGKSQGHTNTKLYVHRDTGAQILNSIRVGSADTHRHTRIPTDAQAGTGVGR